MSSSSETQQQFQKRYSEMMGKISSSFLDLSTGLKNNGVQSEITKMVDKLFRLILDFSQNTSQDMNNLLERLSKLEKSTSQLLEEKRKLEVLYSSGILFSSETEMKSLMELAIDTVIKELSADAGFIILSDEEGKVDSVFAKNMNPDENPEALQMSSTVIKNTIQSIAPVTVNDTLNDEVLSKKTSILKLGISAVLCVPLITGRKVLGAVYLDRRNQDKPFNQNDLGYLLSFARQIIRGLEISLEISTLEKKLISEVSMKFDDLRKEFKCENIIGSSKKLFEILKVASKISGTDASVIILGENGTGKDLLARAIHENSRRASKPFVTIDCGSIPADLLESELFGYESGAFTGATKTKPGKLELADGGTVFFDEIGEMNINLQAKLLRVLQTKEIERLGSVQTKKIDIRVLTATNRDIHELIEKGSFRGDLYYRLKVIEITVPPLRERREDIVDLVRFFLKKHSQNNSTLSISNEALEVLEEYNWPGNIRELENVILRCAVLAKSDIIEISDLPQEIIDKGNEMTGIKAGRSLMEAETEFRRMFILRTLRQTSSKAEAARLLGINRTHFYKMLAQLDIDL